jgi:hypothetical protein
MEGDKLKFYKGYKEGIPDSALKLSSDVMSREQFEAFDERQERYLIQESKNFPLTEHDRELKKYTSKVVGVRFRKGDRQFCAAAWTSPPEEQPLYDLQEDYRLGNADTCAERHLLDQAEQKKKTAETIAVYRGENVVIDEGQLQTLQVRGGQNHIGDRPVMRHMVGPCAYCREAICKHNPSAMIMMPKGILSKDEKQHIMKVPAFLTFPDNDLFEADDPLLKKLEASNRPDLVAARKRQKDFFRKIAAEYPLTDADRVLLTEAYTDLENTPLTDEPYLLIRARTIINKAIEVADEIPPALPKEHFSYLDYPRNKVEVRFVHELLEEAPFPASTERNPGSAHSLHVFVELFRHPGSKEVSLLVPNADTRQRMVERFQRAFIIVNLDGQPAKLPFILFCPNRYKRLDKVGGRA